MLDLIKNCSDGMQYLVTLGSNALKHYLYLPMLYNVLKTKTVEFMSYVPSELQALVYFGIFTALILKVLKWGR